MQKNPKKILGLLAGCGLLAVMNSGQANASVYTYAKSGDEGVQIFSGYNVDTQDSVVYYNAPVGATRYGGCPQSAIACSAGASGTLGSNPNLTASFNQTSLSDTDGGGPSTGSASARADLSTGQLGVAATGTQRTKFGDAFDGVQGNGYAAFGDGLNFLINGASASTLTNIGVTVTLDGSFVVNPLLFGSSLTNQLTFGNASFSTADGFGLAPNSHTASGWASYSFSPDAAGHIVFNGFYTLTGASQHIDFFESLLTHSGNGETTDFNHTSSLTLNLPSNVSFTSTSGVFLTALGAPSAVPEPATWAMMLVGFGGIGLAMRRSKRGVTGVAKVA